ncbi:MAG: tetratricopeptide repeat protein [Bacteroidales bacterium]
MTTPTNIPDQYNHLSGEELTHFESYLLERYFDNNFTLEEKEWFENILLDKYIEKEWDEIQSQKIKDLLDKNQTLKSKYQSWLKASDFLYSKSEENKIKNLLNSQLQEVKVARRTRIINLLNNKQKTFFLLAASVIILIGVGFTLWMNLKPISNEKLYAMYYEPYKLDFEITRDSLPANEYIVKAQKAFLNGEAENTIQYLEQAIKEEPENWQLYLNLGSIYMVTEQFEKAIAIYDKLPPDAGYYYETARWYLGLCYLKTEKQDKAIEVFTQLKDEGKYYTGKTTELLDKINS